MSNHFEEQLRNSLRPVDPDEGFAERVMLRIAREPVRPRARRLPWLAAALAASMILGVVVVQEWQVRREHEGLEARKQLIEALRVTGQKLDLAYQAVNRESRPAAADRSGPGV